MYEGEKIYPVIPTAPEDDSYRIKKLDELEKFLSSEVESRGKLAKSFKRRALATSISDTTVIAAITVLETVSIATLTTGVGLPVSITLAGTGLLLGLGAAIIHKTQKVFKSKAKKHEKIKLLAESKLDTISSLVSKAIEDSTISHDEYDLILKEVKSYRLMKKEIRTKSKAVTNAITAEQREKILALGRKEGEENFLAKIAATTAGAT